MEEQGGRTSGEVATNSNDDPEFQRSIAESLNYTQKTSPYIIESAAQVGIFEAELNAMKREELYTLCREVLGIKPPENTQHNSGEAAAATSGGNDDDDG